MRRRTPPILATLAVAAGLVAAVPAAADELSLEPDVTKRTLFFDVTVGPDNDQTCQVVADLYRPSTATRRNPAPAILTTNGFGGSKDDQAAVGRAFGARGYVVLSYSGLGFGGSGCKITLDHPQWDGKAARQLVSFLGGSKAARDGTRIRYVTRDRVAHDGKAYPDDPRVGMIGGSYGGQIQFAVAGIDPRVDTIVPIITWNDLAYSLAPNNTDFRQIRDSGGQDSVTSRTPGTEKYQWTSLFFGAGIADGIDDAQVDPSRNVGCPNFHDDICRAKAQMTALGYPDEQTLALSREASVASYMHRIRIPTLLVQGEADTLFNLNEAVATYRALQAQGTPVKMIWQSWGHSGGGRGAPGELDLEHPERSYEGRRFAAWFDSHLKGRDVSTGPEFAYFRDWVRYEGIATPAYGTAPAYPVGDLEPLYLSGADRLVTSRDAVRTGSASYANVAGEVPTSYSETSGAQGGQVPDEDTPPRDAPGTFAAWTTKPLQRAVVSVGVPTLRLRLDSPAAEQSQAAGPAGQLLLFAKIYDVSPDGSVTLVHRLVSPTRVPDVTKPVRITLPGVVHRYRSGHRIQVVVAATDAAYRNNKVVTPVTVLTSRRDPGVLRLPVLGSRP